LFRREGEKKKKNTVSTYQSLTPIHAFIIVIILLLKLLAYTHTHTHTHTQLAEMSVHQTREYFKTKYGYIVDNPNVGPTLTKSYWECGNSKPFLEIVKDLTGKELTGKAWIDALNEDLEEHVVQEKKEYDEMIEKCLLKEKQQSNNGDDGSDEIDLDMVVKFVDGDTIISDSNKSGLLGACKEFEAFVAARTASA
jgi:hypothetical protein